jgi:hypothetical protein
VKIPLHTFIETYKDSHGTEEARSMLADTLQRLGLQGQAEFTKEEAIHICKDLQEKSGFVGIVAGILLTRFSKEE